MKQRRIVVAVSSIAVAVSLTLTWSGNALSEERPGALGPIVVGSKVRLQAPTAVQGRVQGTVMEVDRESLLVSTENQRPLRVSRGAITQLEMSFGRSGHAKKGALIGGAIGVAYAAVILALPEGEPCTPTPEYPCYTSGEYAGAMLVGGVLGGALVGHLIKRDVWTPVPLEGLRIGLAPARGGGVRYALSFAW